MAGLLSYRRTLLPGRQTVIEARGNFIYIRDTNHAVNVGVRQVAIGDKSGTAYTLEMRKDEKHFTASEFDQVTIENTHPEDTVVVTIFIGFGDYSVQPPPGTASKIRLVSSMVAVGHSQDPVQVVPADNARISLMIQAHEMNDPPQFLDVFDRESPSAPGLTLGTSEFAMGQIRLFPGDIFYTDYNGELWAQNGGSQNTFSDLISVLEVLT